MDTDERIEALVRSLDQFTQGYIEALFFTDSGEDDDPIPDDLGIYDFDPDSLQTIIDSCAAFQVLNAEILENYDDTDAGRDFWYTREGHGVGFWDGDYDEEDGEALTESSEAFGEMDVYGENGVIYVDEWSRAATMKAKAAEQCLKQVTPDVSALKNS